jgi:hypothetical protein
MKNCNNEPERDFSVHTHTHTAVAWLGAWDSRSHRASTGVALLLWVCVRAGGQDAAPLTA